MAPVQFFIHDARYSIPQLCFIEARDHAEALKRAETLLSQNLNYSHVEVVLGDVLLKDVKRRPPVPISEP